MSKFDPFADHFWDHVSQPIDGCWEWKNSRDHFGKGYGTVRFRGSVWKAHRVAWVLTNGEIPRGKWLLHHCDNQLCVRPSHLYIGDRQNNIDDMMNRGRNRQPKWEDHPNSKLDFEKVEQIRHLRESGLTYSKIMKIFPQVSISTIAFVCQRKTWAF